MNAAGEFRSATDELVSVYGQFPNPSEFNDITCGDCGLNFSNFAGQGGDFCTGIGSR